MLRHYTVVLAVVWVVIYSWLCTQMILLWPCARSRSWLCPVGQ
jgi:hypothetical protein